MERSTRDQARSGAAQTTDSDARLGLLAAIIDSSDDAIVSNTLDGVITSWNRAAERIYGYTSEEVIGKTLSLLVHPDRRAEMTTILAKIRHGQRIDHHETVGVGKDGSAIAISLTVSPIVGGTGSIIGASSIARDITGRRRTEQLASTASQSAGGLTESTRVTKELSETKNLLDNLLQSSIKYSIIGKDLEGNIVSWNEGARRNYGYVPEEILGKNSEVLHAPEDVASGTVKKLLQAAYENGLAEAEFVRVRKDGSRFTANVVITRRNDVSGKPFGYLVISSDVSEKKEAEKQLLFASQYARSLIEASLDPLVTISPEGKITDVNEATIKVTGVPRDELIGTNFFGYFTNPERARAGYERVFAESSITNYPLTIRHRNGHLTEVLYNASVYKDAGGAVLGVVAAARDVTARKMAEAELAAQRGRELERLAELERFQRLTVGRELKMIELKKEIEELKKRPGKE